MTTLSFFIGKTPEEAKKEIQEKINLEKNKEISNLLHTIKSAPDLWDMRVWRQYKDREEVREWIKNDCVPNNCGHVQYCIRRLLYLLVPENVVIDAVMENGNKSYNNRIAPCFIDPELCPRFRKHWNYWDCNCNDCV
jgi:hypothetical protein